jgi:4-hydroxybenzoate polyprenyltransferase
MQIARNYLSLIKFSHTIFALPFALIGFLLGADAVLFEFDRWLILQVILCMVFARSAAMSFNRYTDRHIDAQNERTRSREIPAGVVKPNAALAFTILNSLAFVITTWFINSLCFLLSPVALVVILGYSYTKRFTPFSHLILGLGLSLAPIGAYLAVTGEFAILPLLFSISVIAWVSGFDIIYALQDEEFDRNQKLFSVPSSFGRVFAMRMAQVLHLLSALTLLSVLFYAGFGWLYLTGWILFTGFLIYQHTIISKNDLSRINMAFFTSNGLASVILSLFVAAEILLPVAN